MMLHLVYEQTGRRPRWLPAVFYVAGAIAALAPGDAFENAPAYVFGVAGLAGLILTFGGPAPRTAVESRHRLWTRVLMTLMLACLWQAAPWAALLPDYLVLVFFALTLYYKERLTFFDLFLKRGAFLAIIIAISLSIEVYPLPDWLVPFLLAPLWLLSPWVYSRLSHAVDRLWLRRAYSRVEAERMLLQAVQGTDTAASLEANAVAALSEIFQASVTLKDGDIAIAPRLDGMPFLSEEEALRQSLARTLAVMRDNVRLRELAGRAELKALRAQINPHFLFNALNAIAGLIHTQPALAEETVERLAEVFRYTLRGASREWVRLDEEMEFVAACLGVEKARFGDRLALDIEVAPDAAAVRVPAMCVQPLVENAIKHGTAQREGRGCIAVHAAVASGRVSIQVTDNGPGFPAAFRLESGEGHGLRNIAGRLSGYYGASASLTWENLPEGARVSLEFPCAS
jgi:signal transduction histidine kinase